MSDQMTKNIPMRILKLFLGLVSFGLMVILIQQYVGLETVCSALSCVAKPEIIREKHPISSKQSILLFVAVLNKITSYKRRATVRNTWMTLCDSYNGRVICKFFTDSIDQVPENDQIRIKNENFTNRDMLFMPYKGGYNFSLRLLWIMKWLSKNYNFNYLLRIDDDHFLCLDRLVNELSKRKPEALYWGYIHCKNKIVRVDEGWMILTSDLVQEALSKLNSSLPCHPYGDQAVAMWMIESKLNVTYFYDNDRVIHAATAYQNETFLKPGICDKYLSLHGSYPKMMKLYWQIFTNDTSSGVKKKWSIPIIPPFQSKCPHSNKIFDVNVFYPELRFNAKPCRDNPRWPISGSNFYSREAHGELEY